jgi:nicotinate-nucleotide pyrophosphorylase (carboxylating)
MNKLTLENVIRLALYEDIHEGDVTTNSIVSPQSVSRAVIFSKENAILSGVGVASQVFRHLDKKVKLRIHAKDGDLIKKNAPVITLEGRSRTILTGERTALNFLSYLSGIATTTRSFVDKIRPYKVQILDTRKTTPTLRFLERYAVRCGGGYNHRDNLSEMAMIKDNHWLCSGSKSIVNVVKELRNKTDVAIVVEVDNLTQLQDALQSPADVILLDNMKPETIRKAVGMRKQFKSSVLLEVSGGIRLENVRDYARTGVDRISIGSLTHSRQAIDFSMELVA